MESRGAASPVCACGTPSLARCLWAATVVGRATVAAGVAAPIERGGWLALPLAGAAALLGVVLVGPPGALVGALAGSVVLPVLVMVLAWTVETVGFRRAETVWWLAESGRAAVTRTDPAPGGRVIRSVAAVPRGRGAGRTVLEAVIAAADRDGETLVLRGASPRVSRWYGRWGFEPTAGGRLVRPPATR